MALFAGFRLSGHLGSMGDPRLDAVSPTSFSIALSERRVCIVVRIRLTGSCTGKRCEILGILEEPTDCTKECFASERKFCHNFQEFSAVEAGRELWRGY
ncbi:hypothetical protein [Mesorhizobium sp. LNHC209A00]|uniref:hypothetical protein n=1 Tax=Mesorhizobium TaxID=68287 RepID=UPI0003CFDDB0|nr:hypothetical protein [Mesorhizobium sp. LNHC209A00]ESY90827.1 hypothetical protein X738_29530 [Mesorhizobium sp. LNHC209A00]